MAKSWSLKRTVQCAKCPWKVSTNPNEIPNGYSRERHQNLESTIAREGELNISGPLHVMSCHEEEASHCIGWLHNQLGVGNNIGMRLQMRGCTNSGEMRVVGPQHQTFEDTLP